MHRLTFAGAMLTGLGTIAVIHGGRPGYRGGEADGRQSAESADRRESLAPRAGAIALLAGIVLVAAGSRREGLGP